MRHGGSGAYWEWVGGTTSKTLAASIHLSKWNHIDSKERKRQIQEGNHQKVNFDGKPMSFVCPYRACEMLTFGRVYIYCVVSYLFL